MDDGGKAVDLADLVASWREDGQRADADAIVRAMTPRLADLASALGLLYAQDQATQAVRAALQVANPRAASAMWRRKKRAAASAEDWALAPVATLEALAMHVLLDLAHVSHLSRVVRQIPVAHHAVLRLQVADVLDADQAAALLGVPLSELEAWATSSPKNRDRLRRRGRPGSA